MQRDDPSLAQADLEEAQREILQSQRSTYLRMWQAGQISEDVYERLITDVDARLLQSDGDPNIIQQIEVDAPGDQSAD